MRSYGLFSPGLFGLLLLLVQILTLATVANGRRGGGGGGGNRHPEYGTEDFEFEEETQAQRRRSPRIQDTDVSPTFPSYHGGKKNNASPAKHTQDSELCLALRCSRDEYCLVKNENVALCVSSKKNHKDRKLLPTPSQLLSSAAEDDESDDDESSSDDDDDTSSSEYDDEASWERARASACTSCPTANKPTFVCGSDNKTYSSPCRLHYHNCVHRSAILLACKGFCPCQESKAKHDQKQKMMTHRWNNFVSKYKMTKEQKNNSAHISASTVAPPSHPADKSGTTTVSKLRKPNKTEFSSEQIKYKHTNKQNNKSTSNAVGNPPFAEDKERQKGYNSVLSEKVPTPSSKDKVECSSQDLESMQSRMLDWFAVVMADAKRNKNKRRSRAFGKGAAVFPTRCPQEVQWIFGHLDADEDGRLGLRELLDLERDGRERCVRPFLDHCDSGHDLLLGPAEWCACFDHSERPCLAAKRKSRNGLLGGFTPTCAEDGFFAAMQCHGGAGLCWCVDRHGVEYANTRTRGTPDCDTISGRNVSTSPDSTIEDDNEDDDDDDVDGDDDSMMEGSADHPLDI